MISESLPLGDWLQTLNGAPLYAVLAGASDASPLLHYYRLDGRDMPQGLYLSTPYADWHAVMPYLVPLRSDSPFLPWMAECEAQDWGFVLSQPDNTELHGHLQGLTQVFHQGSAVFFRYWDSPYLTRIVAALADEFPKLIPGIAALWAGGHAFRWDTSPPMPPRPYPWWTVPPALANTLASQEKHTLINNLMQQLAEQNGQLYWSFPQANLRHKVARFLELRQPHSADVLPALEAALLKEVQA
ncbi:DUF4123 domain-containing protein [Aeromonas bivalvium]|uniref:DUF4123 domain-containing protein n=1 Tax=Aeromonas bivalvium TaxID=440079 RepID=UPI0005A7A727|nr:DUF4123 domain-containing protein [Aeromonas bivalvium]